VPALKTSTFPLREGFFSILGHVAQNIRFCDDPYQAIIVHDWKTADLFFDHLTGGLFDIYVRSDRN